MGLSTFIEKSNNVHDNKYDYSKVEYVNSQTKVCIICPEHGEFLQTPNSHLQGSGCPICAGKNKTTEDFIKKAMEVHGDRYDYSKVEYLGAKIKVCVICPEHGEFWQTPDNHLRGEGCKLCSFPVQDTETFIRKSQSIYGDKYNYSKVEYVNSHTKVCIICPEHGEFWQTPNKHLRGIPYKWRKKDINHYTCLGTQEFIERANQVHCNKYDYSKAEYINSQSKVCIICQEHGEFWQTPSNHLSGKGCPLCNKSYKLTQETFIERANQVHANKYDYSKVEYVNGQTKVCIICPEHGEFWQAPNSHLSGKGCPICAGKNKTTEDFIKKARGVHGDRYDYSKVEYTTSSSHVCIICHKKDKSGQEHGEFWQTPNNHLHKTFPQGCPKCNMSKLEESIMVMLHSNNIFCYEYNLHYKWLNGLQLDFYFPQYKIAIECQGIQHFKPISFGSKAMSPEEQHRKIIQNDKKKYKLCKKHNVELLYYSNLGIDYPYNVFENKEEILTIIQGKIQKMIEVKIINKSKHDCPKYATPLSAGLDLRANIDESITINPLERTIIPTGLFIELPSGFEAQVRPRSGLALKHGITVLNTPGTIDADYRGEIKVILVNLSGEPFTINDSERIAQMVITKHEIANLIEVNELSESERGTGGFGSTGK